jgi:hypothetical protein
MLGVNQVACPGVTREYCLKVNERVACLPRDRFSSLVKRRVIKWCVGLAALWSVARKARMNRGLSKGRSRIYKLLRGVVRGG